VSSISRSSIASATARAPTVPSAPGSCAAFTLRFSAISVAARSSSGYGSLATENTTSTRLSLAPPWWLGTPIDDEIANLTIAELLHLESDDPNKDISLYINCPGGSVYAGLAICDTIQFVKPAITTISVGIAMSLGALLLAAGTNGKRMALPNAKILIHQLWGGFEGQASDIEIDAREAIALKRRMEEIVAKHTGQPLEKVFKDMERDCFMTAEEAIEYGLIDRVLAPRFESDARRAV
jgi:ATP-dependent Clp protease protease subunit